MTTIRTLILWDGNMMFNGVKRISFYIIFFLGLLLSATSFALSPEALRLVGQRVKGVPMTLNEVNAMPPACHAIGMGEVNGAFWAEGMKKNGSESLLDRPENAMAKNAGWFHHYCWGLVEKHRAFATVNAANRASQTRIWRNEMQYIVDWTTKHSITWFYLPMVHREIAESHMQEKNYPNALRSINIAIGLNPECTPCYFLLADIHEQLKARDKALAAVTEGLKHTPAARGLQRRYTELGGRLPFPEPYVKPEIPPEPTAEKDTPVSGAPDSTKAEVAPAEPVREQPPGNPYCRFCP